MINCDFFSLVLKKESNLICNKENKNYFGRIDLKIMKNSVDMHIFVFNLASKIKYDIYIIFGEQGKDGYQKAYIITNVFGRLNSNLRIDGKTSKFPIENYKNISCILFVPQDKKFENIVGFKDKIFNYNNVINNKNNFNNQAKDNNKCCNSEKPYFKNKNDNYLVNSKFEEIISNSDSYWPFKRKIDEMKFVKINFETYLKLNLNMRENLIKFIKNNTKIYNYLIFGSFCKKDKTIYMLGIPDKFNPQQAIAMANMGIYKFQCIDLKRNPCTGDLGFWTFHC